MPLPHSFVLTLFLAATAPVHASQKGSCGDDLDSVELRNGARVQNVTASVATLQIETLLKASPAAYRDLVSLAREDGRAVGDESHYLMDQIGLLNERGDLPEDIRSVVVSSAEDVAGGEVRFVSPIAPLKLDPANLDTYHAHVDEIAHDVEALAREKHFPLTLAATAATDPGDASIDAGLIAANGGLAVRVDASGVPLFFVTPTGRRHHFETGATTHEARVEFVGSLRARFGTKEVADHDGIVAITKDRHANPLPDPEFPGH